MKRYCITKKECIKLNTNAFRSGKYWIGDPTEIFTKEEQKELFPELLSGEGLLEYEDLEEPWNRYDMTYGDIRFACHYSGPSEGFSVYHAHKGGLLYHLDSGSLVVVCVPEEFVIQRTDGKVACEWSTSGVLNFDKDWNVFQTEDKKERFFGNFQIRSGQTSMRFV